MNAHILIGVTPDKKHKAILHCADYAQVKKAFIAMKQSNEFSKVEIWSRANGLEKSKRLRQSNGKNEKSSSTPTSAEITDVEIPEESEDFGVETPVAEVAETSTKRKKKGK